MLRPILNKKTINVFFQVRSIPFFVIFTPSMLSVVVLSCSEKETMCLLAKDETPIPILLCCYENMLVHNSQLVNLVFKNPCVVKARYLSPGL